MKRGPKKGNKKVGMRRKIPAEEWKELVRSSARKFLLIYMEGPKSEIRLLEGKIGNPNLMQQVAMVVHYLSNEEDIRT